jgi:hypothetical protein
LACIGRSYFAASVTTASKYRYDRSRDMLDGDQYQMSRVPRMNMERRIIW